MDRYTFRALYNGEFVYGNLIRAIYDGVPFFEIEHSDSQDFATWQVDKETIGQFIGMLDENDVEIFEGDIVKVTNNYHGKKGNFVFKAKIIYNKYVYGYQISYPNINNHFVSDCMKSGYFFEVIGNIHQNPELL